MRLPTLAATLIAAAPALALAHPGHQAMAAGLVEGFMHPFTGVDHIAAMVAVGLWSALTLRRQRWLAPLAFAAMLLAGALFAAPALAFAEPMIAVSLLALGLGVAARIELPALAGALAVGVFALFHGAAHGAQLQGGAALAGMVLATALLHAAGLVIGSALRTRGGWLAGAFGGGVALVGAATLLA
jgi:urease accessory protein